MERLSKTTHNPRLGTSLTGRILRFTPYSCGVLLLELAASLLTPVAGAITYPITDDHPAIDIACRNGAEVRAAHDGVGRPFWDGRMGWTFQLAGGSGLKSS